MPGIMDLFSPETYVNNQIVNTIKDSGGPFANLFKTSKERGTPSTDTGFGDMLMDMAKTGIRSSKGGKALSTIDKWLGKRASADKQFAGMDYVPEGMDASNMTDKPGLMDLMKSLVGL
jgi:hypothetical protein